MHNPVNSWNLSDKGWLCEFYTTVGKWTDLGKIFCELSTKTQMIQCILAQGLDNFVSNGLKFYRIKSWRNLKKLLKWLQYLSIKGPFLDFWEFYANEPAFSLILEVRALKQDKISYFSSIFPNSNHRHI